MTNVVRNRIMRILAVIAIVCVGMVFAFSFSTAKAETIATEGFAVQAQAGVNVSDDLKEEGIAFYTDIDTAIYGEDVQVYTLVVPEKNLVDGDITSLKKETSVDLDGWRIKAVKLPGEGTVKTFMATITFEGLTEDQLAEAYATKLVARSYIVQEDEVIYAQDNLKATAIKDVAVANLAEAIATEAVVTEENIAKWVKYAGVTNVNAFYESANVVEFIDQDLDDAEVYVVNGAEFTKLGDIQNGKLSNVELTEATTQLIVTNGTTAIVTNAIQATQIIDSKEEFVATFGKYYADGNAIMDKAEAYIQAGGLMTDIFDGNQKILLDHDAFKQTMDGYYVLATDITFDAGEKFYTETGITDEAAIAWMGANSGSAIATSGYTFATNWGTRSYHVGYRAFAGTFDGLGHYIDNVQFANQLGIFGNVSGTVKNVAFTNVKFGANSSNHYTLGQKLTGYVENVYVQVTEVGTPYASDKDGVVGNRRAGLFQDASLANGLTNVVIEYPNINEYYRTAKANDAWYGGGYIDIMGYGANKANNVIAITETLFASGFQSGSYLARTTLASNDADLISINGFDITKDGGADSLSVSNGTSRYNTYADLKTANVDLSAFDNGLWDISTGAPVWASLVKENVQILVDEEVVEQINFVANEGTTKTFEIVSDLMDIDYTVEIADPTIATYADGVITKVANGGETTLTYSYVIAGVTYTGSYKITIEKEYPLLGTIIVDNNTTALPELAVDGAIVSVKDVDNGTEYLVEGAIAFENNTDRVIAYDVIITTEAGTEYKATIDVYTKIIMNADEFKEIFWTPEYSMIQTHTITYNSQTYTETFDELVDTDKVVKNGTSVYMDLSEEFKQMLADGATRAADSTTINASVVTGAYILGADIVDLGSNRGTYVYNYSPKVVTTKYAGNGSVAASDTVIWGSASYDRAGYQLAGANAYLYEQEFTGLVDGNGHTISGFNSLTQGGLFGTLKNAIIKNLAVTGVVTETYKSNGAVQDNSASSGVIAYQNIGEETRIENVYIEITNLPTNTTRFGAIYYNNHASGSKVSTIKDVVIVMPTHEWDYTQTFGIGIIGSSTSSGATFNPVTENVVAITGTDLVSGYGHASVGTRRAWIAENDAAWYEDGGKFNSTIIGSRRIQTGLFRYNDLSSAVAAGKTQVGSWVITAEGVVKA